MSSLLSTIIDIVSNDNLILGIFIGLLIFSPPQGFSPRIEIDEGGLKSFRQEENNRK
jgi:hypothetical protein